MQPWMVRGLDALYARLTEGVPLPPSQVLRSRPRGPATGGGVARLEAHHLGELRAEPGADAIRFNDGVLTVPD
jgi:hydroxybutyrate-dimer hydrolase